jgi:hypothetical protein
MAREPIDLAELLDEVTAFQEPAAAAAGVRLVRRIGDARAVGDRERLKQVFHNLLVNAMEATPHGGVVTVSCHRGADEPDATVTIADTGRGIPTGTLERVFEPFFTTKEAGTGLGLSIVRQIVERHGGGPRIDLESAEGRGDPGDAEPPRHRGARTNGGEGREPRVHGGAHPVGHLVLAVAVEQHALAAGAHVVVRGEGEVAFGGLHRGDGRAQPGLGAGAQLEAVALGGERPDARRAMSTASRWSFAPVGVSSMVSSRVPLRARTSTRSPWSSASTVTERPEGSASRD